MTPGPPPAERGFARARHSPDAVPGLGPRPVARESAVDLVIEEIRRTVVNGMLAPGSVIPIVELSERLGVSHTPVREALRRLEADGLVELNHNRGAIVAPLSLDDLDDLFHQLQRLEADVGGRSARLYTQEHLAIVGQAWDALRLVPDDDAADLSLRHARFHQMLIAPAARPWDWRLLGQTWLAASRYMFSSVQATMSKSPNAFRKAHEPLLVAARTRSAPGMRKAIVEHLENDRRLAEAALRAAER